MDWVALFCLSSLTRGIHSQYLSQLKTQFTGDNLQGEEKTSATAKILVLGQRTAQCPFMMHYNILCNGVKDFIPQCVDQEFCTADKFFQHGIVIIRNGGIIRPVPAFCPADII